LSFDGTLPRTADLHRHKVREKKRDHEFARRFKEEQERRRAEALKLVEERLGSYEDRRL